MAVTNKDIVAYATTEEGKPYIWDAKGPNEFDCSGLVSFTCHHFGIEMPDGAIYQMQFCKAHNTLISVEDAQQTPGALLFRISNELGNHVVISLGDSDMDVEARGVAWGVGSWSEDGRVWTHAATIPGVSYV